ncbi:MAG: hypothetical protein NT178_02000 [Proteobacteria bacterium]|nr:hypothetical protein [Pseudomonadota bacterium]
MDKKKVIAFIDTNVFVVDLRYKDDKKFKINRDFLDFVASGNCKGITSIYNLLEVCGILSFKLNEQQLRELYYFLPEKYKIDIMPSRSIDSYLPTVYAREIMDLMYGKASFGDALIAGFVKKKFSANMIFVSWDADHFKHLLPTIAHTPEEFLKHLQS